MALTIIKPNKAGNGNKAKPANAKPVGAIEAKDFKPAFTADRLFVWIVGGAAALTGLYIIGRFVKMGLDKMEGTDQTTDKTSTKTADGQVKDAAVITLPQPSAFPIAPDFNNLYAPPYRRDVEILQQAMADVWGKANTLPTFGVDGKFGMETLNAVKRYLDPDGVVSEAVWYSLARHWAQVRALKEMAARTTQPPQNARVAPNPDGTFPQVSDTPTPVLIKPAKQVQEEIELDMVRVPFSFDKAIQDYDLQYSSPVDMVQDGNGARVMEGLGSTDDEALYADMATALMIHIL